MRIAVNGEVVEGVEGFDGLQQVMKDVLYGNLHGAEGMKFSLTLDARLTGDGGHPVEFTSADIQAFDKIER